MANHNFSEDELKMLEVRAGIYKEMHKSQNSNTDQVVKKAQNSFVPISDEVWEIVNKILYA